MKKVNQVLVELSVFEHKWGTLEFIVGEWKCLIMQL